MADQNEKKAQQNVLQEADADRNKGNRKQKHMKPEIRIATREVSRSENHVGQSLQHL